MRIKNIKAQYGDEPSFKVYEVADKLNEVIDFLNLHIGDDFGEEQKKEEKDDWTLKNSMPLTSSEIPTYLRSQIVTLKEKILQDVDKKSSVYYSNEGIKKINQDDVIEIIWRRFGF